MDPQATLQSIVEAIHFNDKLEAAERADDLNHWLNNDGFAPNVNRETLQAFLVAVMQHHPDGSGV